MDSYQTPLDVISTDIKKVGGGNAYLGQLRIANDGKRYILVQSHDINGTDLSVNRYIVAYKGGQSFRVTLAVSSGRCNGVTVISKDLPIATGGVFSYMWMQVAGRAENIAGIGVTAGSYVGSQGAGIGISLTAANSLPIVSVVTHLSDPTLDHTDPDVAFTLTNTGVIGWALSDAVANLATVEIDPGYQWTGTLAGALSITTGDET
jgi:hypothetical protein